MSIKNNFEHTIYASYLGGITQAIVNNFAPLLFLVFQKNFGISIDKIALLITFNFGVQLLVDFAASKFADKIGYKKCIVAAQFLCGAGLVGMAVLPSLINPFGGLLISVVTYAIGGGLIEVLVSPIVEACPTKKKEAAMSLLHSFYCWGQAGVILLSTLFFFCFGIENWRILAILWAILPLCNGIYFCLVPIRALNDGDKGMTLHNLFKVKKFWLVMILMCCAGACEQSVSQWASAFAESELGISKSVGDLAGPCAFAVLMGISRVFYSKKSEKIKLETFMKISGLLCIAAYLLISLSPLPVFGLVGCGLCGLSVGIMWPGTFSIAAKEIKYGGTQMFAFLALSGDLGCSVGPTLVGVVSKAINNNLKIGILSAVVFPAVLIFALFLNKKNIKSVEIEKSEYNEKKR